MYHAFGYTGAADKSRFDISPYPIEEMMIRLSTRTSSVVMLVFMSIGKQEHIADEGCSVPTPVGSKL